MIEEANAHVASKIISDNERARFLVMVGLRANCGSNAQRSRLTLMLNVPLQAMYV